MQYRLVALDLDGTLMGPDLVIPRAVREAVAEARAADVHVTIATGRMYGATLPYARELGIQVPLICYQGAMVRHPVTGETSHHTPAPCAPAAEAAAALEAAGIFTVAYIDEVLHVSRAGAELDLYLSFHPEGAEVVIADDLPALVRERPPTKLLLVAEPAVVGRELERMATLVGDRLAVVRSHANFGELTAPTVSKGAALAMLAADLGVTQEQTIAIGDQENDLSMIAWAGLGLAMGNAIPAVKALAQAVVPPVEQAGVAAAIRRYVLGHAG